MFCVVLLYILSFVLSLYTKLVLYDLFWPFHFRHPLSTKPRQYRKKAGTIQRSYWLLCLNLLHFKIFSQAFISTSPHKNCRFLACCCFPLPAVSFPRPPFFTLPAVSFSCLPFLSHPPFFLLPAASFPQIRISSPFFRNSKGVCPKCSLKLR